MKKYKGVIFDLDGTLLDTLEDLTSSINHTFRKFGIEEKTPEDVRGFLGNGVRNLLKQCAPADIDENDFQEILLSFKKHYELNCNNKTGPYKGITEVLGKLKEEKYLTAIVSNKVDSAVKALNRLYFENWIKLAFGETETVKRKPAPDMVFACLKEMGLKADEAVYVGDSEVDFETAKNAGMDCISVSWGFRDRGILEEIGAEVIIDSPEELMEKIL